ncbi:unnamed protein product [Cladocopium goreaui]|uniref:Calcineurin-like phosphoesterase domain-containing protein n=1 Tax=Cladocopium goreaui TaxID=2562237 RepID=A0A9P1DHA4_9DINO|nr:unnamed protein product [Cladocopium goreaui]
MDDVDLGTTLRVTIASPSAVCRPSVALGPCIDHRGIVTEFSSSDSSVVSDDDCEVKTAWRPTAPDPGVWSLYRAGGMHRRPESPNDQKGSGVDFIAQLGDFVDGCNQDLPGGGRKALQELLGPVDQGPPVLHLIGNHELYNFARKEMEDGIPLPGLKVPFRTSAPPALDAEAPSKTSSYYSFSPADGWRVCVLDPYEISIMSHGGGRPGVDEVTLEPGAVSWCQENNPNDITKEDFARGIPPGEARRWVPLNGAVSEQQLIWLEETLELASKKNEETIILSHVVLLPEATPGQNGLTLLWNYDKVLQVLRSAERPPTAVLCGHAHLMVNSRDQVSGTHHVTLPTPVEANPGSDACAVVEAFSNGLLKIRGRGDVLSSTLACSTHATCT